MATPLIFSNNQATNSGSVKGSSAPLIFGGSSTVSQPTKSLPITGSSQPTPAPAPVIQPSIFQQAISSADQILKNIQSAVLQVQTYKPKTGEGVLPLAPIGRLLQKTPNTNVSLPASIGTPVEKKMVEFFSGFPGEIARSYGRTLETLSTVEGKEKLKQGVKDLPQTINQVKTHIEKQEWQEALDTAFSNPAVSVALDVSDFIPLATLTGLTIKKGLSATRTTAKTILKQGVEEIAETAIKNAPTSPSLISLKKEASSPIYSSADSFANNKLGTKPGSLIGEIDPKKVTARDPINRATVDDYKTQIETGKSVEPIIVREEGGKLITTDGSQRITAYQELGKKAPVIVTKFETPIEGLRTVDEFYSEAKSAATTQPITQPKVVKTPAPKKVATPKASSPAPKKVTTPKAKAPRLTAEGKTPSKIALSIERKAIESGLTRKFENIAGYDKITIKDQAKRAADLVNTDFEKARKIVRGEEKLPRGLRGTSLITAMEEHIKKTGSADVAYDLANSPLVSETSFAAQELRLAAEREPDSLVIKLRELKQLKDEMFKKRYDGKTVKDATDDTVKQINKEVTKFSPDKSEWSSFIKSIQC